MFSLFSIVSSVLIVTWFCVVLYCLSLVSPVVYVFSLFFVYYVFFGGGLVV